MIRGKVISGGGGISRIPEDLFQSRCKAARAKLVKGSLNVRVEDMRQALGYLGQPDFETEQSDQKDNNLRWWQVALAAESTDDELPGKTFVVRHTHTGPGNYLDVLSEVHFRTTLNLNDNSTVQLRRLKQDASKKIPAMSFPSSNPVQAGKLESSTISEKKVISFSLFGIGEGRPKEKAYLVGVVRNIELAAQIYPGWICRFYVDPSVPEDVIEKITSYPHTEIVRKNPEKGFAGMFWRHEAIADPDVEIAVCRDLDSRLTRREKSAVDEWLGGDKHFHIMRDYPLSSHHKPMMGGMWGARKPRLQHMKQLIANCKNKQKRGADEDFLGEIIYPLAVNDSCVHDEFFEGFPFPLPRQGFEFVGETIDEHENPVRESRSVMKNFLESGRQRAGDWPPPKVVDILKRHADAEKSMQLIKPVSHEYGLVASGCEQDSKISDFELKLIGDAVKTNLVKETMNVMVNNMDQVINFLGQPDIEVEEERAARKIFRFWQVELSAFSEQKWKTASGKTFVFTNPDFGKDHLRIISETRLRTEMNLADGRVVKLHRLRQTTPTPPVQEKRSVTNNLKLLGSKYRTDKVDRHHTFKGETYMDVYTKYFTPFQSLEFVFLEIGVRDGASLRVWAEYFPNAKIVGVDINPECKRHETDRISIEIGSQADEMFWQQVTEKHGPFKIVLDDGSHINSMTLKSFECLRDSVESLYIIEDLRMSYEDVTQAVKSWPGMHLNQDLNADNSATRPRFNDEILNLIKELDYRRGDWTAFHFHAQILVMEKKIDELRKKSPFVDNE